MSWIHVRASVPGGSRVPAWRCDTKECAALTFVIDQPKYPCKHPRLKVLQPPRARKEP